MLGCSPAAWAVVVDPPVASQPEFVPQAEELGWQRDPIRRVPVVDEARRVLPVPWAEDRRAGLEDQAQRAEDRGPTGHQPEGRLPGRILLDRELPPASPDAHLAPLLEPTPASAPHVVAAPERPRVVLKTLVGLLVLLVLAYLGGHPRVRSVEQTLGLSQVITAGLPFVLLGMLARHPSIGVLSDAMLAELAPILRFALGWIGFVVGFRFDGKLLVRLPKGVAIAVVFLTFAPFAAVAVICGAYLLLITSAARGWNVDPVFLRDALLLGTAGAMTAAGPVGESGAESLRTRVRRLEEIAGVVGLAAVAAYFRPDQQGTWQLPGTAWLFVTLGLGCMLGVVVYAVIQRSGVGAEFAALALGSISFAAGAASHIGLSPVVVAFVAGAVAGNLPGDVKDRLGEVLTRLERPIYLLFLVVVGALWQIEDWRGWVLMVLFAGVRLVGKWAGARLSTGFRQKETMSERLRVALTPMGPLAIAIVVSAQLLYPGGSIGLVVSAVVGGALLTEVALQLGRREQARASTAAPSSSSSPPSSSEAA